MSVRCNTAVKVETRPGRLSHRDCIARGDCSACLEFENSELYSGTITSAFARPGVILPGLGSAGASQLKPVSVERNTP